jgi:O-antigen/teichoic acid export membrane protein
MSSWNNIKNIVTKFKGLTTIGFTNIIASAISGLFWFYIARLLGTTHYGEVSYIIAISGIALTFSLFGSGNALLVYTAKGVKIQPPVYFISIVAIAIASIVLYFIFYNIGLCLLVVGNGIFGLATLELLGLKSYKKYAQYFIIQRILMVALAISLYYFIGYNGIIIGIGLSYFPALIQLYKVFRGSKIDFSLIKPRFSFLFISYILDISRTFGSSIDKIIVAPMLGFALLGNYQLGIQFLSVLTIFPSVVYYYLVPHDASGNPNARLKKISIVISVGLAIPSIVLSPFVVPILFPKFTEAVQVIQIVSLSIIPITISNMYISKFLGNEKIRIVLIGAGIFIAIQIPTILLFGKIFGVNGIALSYVLATTVEAIYLITIDRLYFKKRIIKFEDQSTKFEDQSTTNNRVSNIDFIERKIEFLVRNPIISIFILCTIGLFFRLYYFPYNVPLTLDALNSYFFYASDTSILGHFPTNHIVGNNGWPAFLSIFFTIFRFENTLDYMTFQRLMTVSISVLTIIPVYLLCRRFFDKPYALIGAAIFALEPHIIQNSLFGLTEPLYIILITLSLVLFFSSNKKMTYASFAITGLASLVRTEGLFLFFPLIIMFYVKNRKGGMAIAKSTFAVSIFIATIIPMAIIRIKSYGQDSLSSRISDGVTGVLATSSVGKDSFTIFIKGIINIVEFTAWSLIPILICLVPIGIFLILKKKSSENITIIVTTISMSLPVVFAFYYLQDTRFIYPLFPIFCILSIFTIKKLGAKFKDQNIFLVLIIGGIILSSGIFLDIKKYDYEHQKESFSIAQSIISIAKGVNDYYPDDSFIKPAEIPQKWPVLSSTIPTNTIIIPTQGFDSLEKYIESSKSKGLTDLVVDGAKNRPYFLNDVFYHDEKYPYLVKVFDSWNHGYKYHLKIYKIEYQNFDQNK